MANSNIKAIRRVPRFLICLTLLSLLCACFYVPSKEKSVYYNERVDLLVLYQYSVAFFTEDLQSVGDIEIYPVEEDEYGRTLGIAQFNAKYRDPLFGENAVYCVLQKGGKNESWFYEDVCCVMVENSSDPSEAVEVLKQSNDWDRPFVAEKCRKIPFNSYHASGDYNTDYGYNYESLAKKACKAVNWSADNAWFEVTCKDGNGLWLFSLKKDSRKADSPVCMIMMKEDPPVWGNGDSELTVIGTHLLENRASPWAEIHAFKEKIGWAFVNQPKRTSRNIVGEHRGRFSMLAERADFA